MKEKGKELPITQLEFTEILRKNTYYSQLRPIRGIRTILAGSFSVRIGRI